MCNWVRISAFEEFQYCWGDRPYTLMSALEFIAKARNLRGECMFHGKATGSDTRGEPGLQQTSLVLGQVVSTAWGQLGSGGGGRPSRVRDGGLGRCVETTQVSPQCWRLKLWFPSVGGNHGNNHHCSRNGHFPFMRTACRAKLGQFKVEDEAHCGI